MTSKRVPKSLFKSVPSAGLSILQCAASVVCKDGYYFYRYSDFRIQRRRGNQSQLRLNSRFVSCPILGIFCSVAHQDILLFIRLLLKSFLQERPRTYAKAWFSSMTCKRGEPPASTHIHMNLLLLSLSVKRHIMRLMETYR